VGWIDTHGSGYLSQNKTPDQQAMKIKTVSPLDLSGNFYSQKDNFHICELI
jgi:hypothetical protein